MSAERLPICGDQNAPPIYVTSQFTLLTNIWVISTVLQPVPTAVTTDGQGAAVTPVRLTEVSEFKQITTVITSTVPLRSSCVPPSSALTRSASAVSAPESRSPSSSASAGGGNPLMGVPLSAPSPTPTPGPTPSPTPSSASSIGTPRSPPAGAGAGGSGESSQRPSAGVVAGAIVGASALLILLVLLVCGYRRRKRAKRRTKSQDFWRGMKEMQGSGESKGSKGSGGSGLSQGNSLPYYSNPGESGWRPASPKAPAGATLNHASTTTPVCPLDTLAPHPEVNTDQDLPGAALARRPTFNYSRPLTEHTTTMTTSSEGYRTRHTSYSDLGMPSPTPGQLDAHAGRRSWKRLSSFAWRVSGPVASAQLQLRQAGSMPWGNGKGQTQGQGRGLQGRQGLLETIQNTDRNNGRERDHRERELALLGLGLGGEVSGESRLGRMPSLTDLRRFSGMNCSSTEATPSHLIASRPGSVFTTTDETYSDGRSLPPPPMRSNSIVRKKSTGVTRHGGAFGNGHHNIPRKRVPRSPVPSSVAPYKSFPSPRDRLTRDPRRSSQLLPSSASASASISGRSLYPRSVASALSVPSFYLQSSQPNTEAHEGPVPSSSIATGTGSNASGRSARRRPQSGTRRPPRLKLAREAVTPSLWMDDEHIAAVNPLSPPAAGGSRRKISGRGRHASLESGQTPALVSVFSPTFPDYPYDGLAGASSSKQAAPRAGQKREVYGHRRAYSDSEPSSAQTLAYLQPGQVSREPTPALGGERSRRRGRERQRSGSSSSPPLARLPSFGTTPSLPPLDSAASSSFKADWEAAVARSTLVHSRQYTRRL